LLVATRERSTVAEVGVSVLHRSRTAAHWRAPMPMLAFDGSPGSPWLLLPPEVRTAFELLRESGEPLSESRFGRPLLGVKCGLNEAFIATRAWTVGDLTRLRAGNGREADVESMLLRPVARGEDVSAWRCEASERRIVWTHGVDGTPLARLPAGALHWLSPHRRMLVARSDARQARRWWGLFRTEAAACDKPRVVWADIGRSVRAATLSAGDPTVPLNTCYVLRVAELEDALALTAILNSPLASAWLSVIAEQARGGYRRYLGWTMSLLPLPRDGRSCRSSLAALTRRGQEQRDIPCADELLDAAIAAYGLERSDVESLLAWTSD
jgi:hypothetical protein